MSSTMRCFRLIEELAQGEERYSRDRSAAWPYRKKSNNDISGDWADCLLEMDSDFGKMLDLLA
jgi:hypothetical protein